MSNPTFITLSIEELKAVIISALTAYDANKKANTIENPNQTLTINQVAKQLDLSYNTVKRLIILGDIITTVDGKRITRQALHDYLKS